MKIRKRKLSKQNVILAVYGCFGLFQMVMAPLFFLYALLSDDNTGRRIFWGVLLILAIWTSVVIWRTRAVFFDVVEIQEDGIVDRCLTKRTVFVPWEEIERVKIGWIHTGVMEHHLFLNVIRKESETFHRPKADIANGFDYHIALDEQSVELLKEYLPQRLKDMLGPHAFD